MKLKPMWLVPLLFCCGLRGQTQAAPEAIPDGSAVPHGEVHHETFPTKYVKGLPGDVGKFVVYTPANYDPARKPAYPVLYLMHGWGGNAEEWVNLGHADVTLDRLIAIGKAKPMIVVMPLSYGDMTFLTNGFEVWRDEEQISNNVNLFESALLKEIMPQVEKSYDAATDREHRAIAGLSMGGLEALTIGLRNADLFASIGGFSSAIFPVAGADLMKLDAKTENLRLLWVACGKDDELASVNRIFEMHMRREGLPVTSIETPGRHEWPVWQDNLRHFVPLLFSDAAGDTASPEKNASDGMSEN